MKFTLIKFIKLRKIFKIHTKIIRTVYEEENLVMNISSIFQTGFKKDRAERLYAVVNPQIQNMKFESLGVTTEYNESGPSIDSYVHQWFMNRLFVVQKMLRDKELFDILTSDIQWVGPEGYENYLITIKPIIFDDYVNAKNAFIKRLLVIGSIFIPICLIIGAIVLYY